MNHRDALINSFAYRSFRDMADGDYIAARVAYRAQLVPQFLWLSQQAIEKYLKCILLLNRIPATRVGHNLGKALGLIDAQAPFTLSLSESSRTFIVHVDTYGQCRYLETSFYVRDFDVIRLDRSVWDLRRYCTVLNYEMKLSNGKTVVALDIEIQKIKNSELGAPKPFRLDGGRLEEVIDQGDHPARPVLIWNNLFFGGRSRKGIRMRAFMSSTNSPLSMHPEIVDDLDALVMLPKDVKLACHSLLSAGSGQAQDNAMGVFRSLRPNVPEAPND